MKTFLWLSVGILCCSSASAAELEPGVDSRSPDPIIREYTELTKKVLHLLAERATDIKMIPDPARGSPEFKKVRDLKTKLWLRLLDEVDGFRDPNFDFEDRPTLNVSPPLGVKSSVPLMAGMDPAAIPDPDIRREYETAIRKTNEKAARHQFQLRVRRTDAQWTEEVGKWLASTYTGAPGDAQELVNYLDAYLSSEARRAEMKKRLQHLLGTPADPSN